MPVEKKGAHSSNPFDDLGDLGVRVQRDKSLEEVSSNMQ